MDLDAPLRALLAPLGLDLYDVEMASGTLHVTVDRDGGVDLDTLAQANGVVSRWLDEADPIAGRYTLDVSSPGLERRLRTPAHFAGATGEVVTLRELRGDDPTRRLEGVLVASNGDSATIADAELGEVTVRLEDVERARTVFAWGSTPKPSPSRGKSTTNASKRG